MHVPPNPVFRILRHVLGEERGGVGQGLDNVEAAVIFAFELGVSSLAEDLEVRVGSLLGNLHDHTHVSLLESVIITQEHSLFFVVGLVLVEQVLHELHLIMHVERGSDRFFVHVTIPVAIV